MHAQTYLTSLPSSLRSHATVHPYHFIKFISDCFSKASFFQECSIHYSASPSLSPQCINYSCLSHQLKKFSTLTPCYGDSSFGPQISLHPHLLQVRPREADLCGLHHSHAFESWILILPLSNRRSQQENERGRGAYLPFTIHSHAASLNTTASLSVRAVSTNSFLIYS